MTIRQALWGTINYKKSINAVLYIERKCPVVPCIHTYSTFPYCILQFEKGFVLLLSTYAVGHILCTGIQWYNKYIEGYNEPSGASITHRRNGEVQSTIG